MPTTSSVSGTLRIFVKGNPFSGKTEVYDNLVIRPNDSIVNKVYIEELDEVEKFLINKSSVPKYTSTFQVPTENDEGQFYIQDVNVTFPVGGLWNLDISSEFFENYLVTLNDIGVSFDEYKTNLISRFFYFVVLVGKKFKLNQNSLLSNNLFGKRFNFSFLTFFLSLWFRLKIYFLMSK